MQLLSFGFPSFRNPDKRFSINDAFYGIQSSLQKITDNPLLPWEPPYFPVSLFAVVVCWDFSVTSLHPLRRPPAVRKAPSTPPTP